MLLPNATNLENLYIFNSIQNIKKNYFKSSFLTQMLFKNVYLLSTYLAIFQLPFCYWLLAQFHCVWRASLAWFLLFLFIKVCFIAYTWSIIVNVPHGLQKNAYSAVVEWSILEMSVRSSSLVLFSSTVYILIFCLLDLSVTVGGCCNLQL